MALPKDIDDREYQKFIETGTNEVAMRVLNAGLNVPSYDYVAVTYPIDTREVYTFKTGGSGGTTVATITLNYTDSTKQFLSSVARS